MREPLVSYSLNTKWVLYVGDYKTKKRNLINSTINTNHMGFYLNLNIKKKKKVY